MRTSPALRPVESRPRAGFTLLELLAVVAVIAVLLALLLPAIMGGGAKARIVQTKVEIGGLTKAIADFKVKYGMEPPSSITLHEAAADWNNTDAATISSRAMISRIWPQFNFGIDRNINDDVDSMNNPVKTSTFTLSGSECLVFFLGGVVKWNDVDGDGVRDSMYDSDPIDDQWIPVGFSRNPANPFDNTGTNRDRFYEFADQSRLDKSTTNHNFYGYADPMPGTLRPYLYVNSNEGQGYNPATDFGDLSAFGLTVSTVYLNGPNASSSPWNPNGFQIISAGLDRKYGGGPNAPNPTPFAGPYQKGNLPTTSGNATDRDFERDNITNFSDGVLVP